MSSTWKITVLCPTGHRVTVKASRESPILKVLTEACQKRGLDPDRHRLRHHKTLLDNGLSIRFANLPNNATVDLIEAEESATARPSSGVSVAVDLEGHGRTVLRDVPVQSDLYSLLRRADAAEKGQEGEEPVVVYMRREIVGVEALKNTTLVQLGVTAGSVLLKLFYKTPDALKDQAKVVNLEPPRPVAPAEREWRPMKTDPDITLSRILPPVGPGRERTTPDDRQEPTPSNDREEVTAPNDREEPMPPKGPEKKSGPVKEMETAAERDCDVYVDADELSVDPPSEVLKYVGSGNAVIFEIGEGGSKRFTQRMSQLSDDFFELNIDDVKMIHKDSIKKVKELEEGEQMLTKSMKKAQEEGRKLQTMNRYKKCLIRVTFPQESLVVQGAFSPGQTIKEVKDFLREFLVHPDMKFYLFTTPPRKVLDPGVTLIDSDCVPAAVLHFKPEEWREEKTFLKPDVWNSLSNSTGVEKAIKEAGLLRKTSTEQSIGLASTATRRKSLDTISEEGQGVKRPSEPLKRSPEDKKMPKWFRSGKQ